MDSSVYKKITAYLLELISRNANIPNFKLPSERVIAASFDASRKPVRHAYEELIERGYVTRVHGSGYYISDDIKTDDLLTAFQKNIKISFVIPSITTHYSHTIISGVSDFCKENKIEYTIHVSDDLPDKEDNLLHSIPRSGSMGIILFPADNDVSSHSELIRFSIRKYPFVMVDRRLPNIDASFVATDDHQAMVDAVQFLYQNGYKNPVYITPPPQIASSVDSRINGYTHGLLKCFQMISPRNLLILSDNKPQQKNDALRHLQKYPDTDIIIVPGSLRTPVLAAMKTLKLQNIKLMIFDDELTYAERELLKPFFILQDGYRIGYAAAETLYNHILGDMRPVVKLLPVEVIDSENQTLFDDFPAADAQPI